VYIKSTSSYTYIFRMPFALYLKYWHTTNQIVQDREKTKLKALVNEDLPTYIFDECDKLCFKCVSSEK